MSFNLFTGVYSPTQTDERFSFENEIKKKPYIPPAAEIYIKKEGNTE